MKEKITIRPDFLIIPGPVAFSKKLKPADKNVYGVVYWLDSLKDGKCTASNQYIGKVCGMTPNSVGNSLQSLENEGFVKRLFKDQKKKNRSQIIPLSRYSFHQMMEPVPSNDGTNDPSNDGQIRKNKKSKSNNVVADATDGKVSKGKEDRPMNLSQFVEWCSKSPQKHIQIIGEWAETTKPAMETVCQWEAYIKRHLRPARDLVPFSHDQLERGFARMKEAKYLDTATLETLFKFLTNAKIK